MADIRFVKPRSDNRIRHFPGISAQTDVTRIAAPASIDKPSGHVTDDDVHITTRSSREKDKPALKTPNSDVIHVTTPKRATSQNLPYDLFITSRIGEHPKPDTGPKKSERSEKRGSSQNSKVGEAKEHRSHLHSEPTLSELRKSADGHCHLDSGTSNAGIKSLDQNSFEKARNEKFEVIGDDGLKNSENNVAQERLHVGKSTQHPCIFNSERDIKEICKPGALRSCDISSATSGCSTFEVCKPGALRTHDIRGATSDCSTFEVTSVTTKISRTRTSNVREHGFPNVTCENLRQIAVSNVTKMNADNENCEKTNFDDRLFTVCCPHEANITAEYDISKTYKGEDNNGSLSVDSDAGGTGMSLTVRSHSECDLSDAADEAKDLFPENIPTAGVIPSRSPHRATPCPTQSQSSRSQISYLPNTEKPQRRRPMRRSVSDVALPGMRYGASFFGFVSDSKFQGRKDNIDPDDEDDFTVDLDQMIKQLESGRSRKPTRNEWGNIIGTNMHHGGSESALNTKNGDERRHSKARSSVSSRSGSTSSDRLRIRRCALADPERMIMSQEDRERIEKDVQKRRQSMVRKVSQFFNVQLGLNQEEDLI